MAVGNSIISMHIAPFLYKLRILPELIFFWNLFGLVSKENGEQKLEMQT